MQIKSKVDAQKRADQIESFQTELECIQQEEIVFLDEGQQTVITEYHKNLIDNLANDFDIDSSAREKQLSSGMKIASFFGAFGLATSVFFLFYQFWGNFSTNAQVFVLVATPFITLAATLFILNKEKTGYFVKLLSLVCLTCFVLNLVMLGQIFNITPSPNAMLVWAIFAFLLAYATNTRLLLAIGIISLTSFLSARFGVWSGMYWIHFGERPENFLPVAFMLFMVPYLPHHKFSGFDAIYRVFAMLIFFVPVLILSNWGSGSYFYQDDDLIEKMYQVIGFIFSAGAIWVGIKKDWSEVVNTGNVFFIIFLYTKFFDWWWDWLPKYVFFLLIGLTAILMLFIFKRLRASVTWQERIQS